jgi:RNA polymerase sigma factor (sigma-70 family)
MTQSEDIEDLVTRAAQGDGTALTELFARYGPLIRRVLRGRWARMGPKVAWREEPMDLEQRFAVEVLRSLPKHAWQGRRAFVAWMRRLADAVAVDAARYHGAQRRDARLETPLPSAPTPAPPRASAESVMEQDRQLADLRALLERIKPEYAAAVQLHYMGYTHREIGEMLGCSAEAARKLVARAEARLVQLREQKEPEG